MGTGVCRRRRLQSHDTDNADLFRSVAPIRSEPGSWRGLPVTSQNVHSIVVQPFLKHTKWMSLFFTNLRDSTSVHVHRQEMFNTGSHSPHRGARFSSSTGMATLGFKSYMLHLCNNDMNTSMNTVCRIWTDPVPSWGGSYSTMTVTSELVLPEELATLYHDTSLSWSNFHMQHNSGALERCPSGEWKS